ncbi:hypothetical protein M2651_13245 [Clostridium sp. SYSU_GA19001]|uniref:CsxC family protein n=1 Tax=Clostridium caldaquaticum TaxID=2940653 RepID=UPI0020773FF7|nr:hypothetical protein [Clostridium caldaquaticum]MCM8711965.1 hypothetical protein [Clostridium caldaquaticum]
MSKKHRHDYNLEHTLQSIVPEQQLIILIALLLVFYNRYEKYNAVQKKYKKEDIKLYSSKGVFVKESEIKDAEIDNSIIIDDNIYNGKHDLKLRETVIYDVAENIQSDIGESQKKIIQETPEKEHIIAHFKLTVLSTSAVQFNPSENDEKYYTIEPPVLKIPVILSESSVQIFVEAIEKFPEPVFEIKDINKNIFLNQCKLIPGTNKLFIKGFIKEEVEYATAECINTNSISGNIKKAIFNIPFQCVTNILFHVMPKISNLYEDIDLEVVDKKMNGIDFREKSYEYFQFLNEKVFAELDSTEILETDIYEEIKILENTLDGAYTFEKMRSKIILNIKLNLVQNQKVFILNC